MCWGKAGRLAWEGWGVREAWEREKRREGRVLVRKEKQCRKEGWGWGEKDILVGKERRERGRGQHKFI